MIVKNGVFTLGEAQGISFPDGDKISFVEDGNRVYISILTVKRLMNIIEFEENKKHTMEYVDNEIDTFCKG